MGRSQAVPRGGSGEFGPGADDTGCGMLHVDMDAFYASVEVRRHPELRGRPVVVGWAGPRGVVCSASYEARAYGVRSAMPGVRAQRLCPQAVFLPPDFAAYTAASRAVMSIFRDVTPLVEPLSLDEAFLDVTGAVRLLGRPAEIAGLIRRRVAEKSIGAETTFDVDVADPEVIRRTLLGLAGKTAGRLRRGGQAGRTVVIKVRLADFRTLNRSRTLPVPTDVTREIFQTAWALFEALRPGDRIRLVGVRVEGLTGAGDSPRQLTLGERDHGWREAELAADAAAARFGHGAVRPASLLGTSGERSNGGDPTLSRDQQNR